MFTKAVRTYKVWNQTIKLTREDTVRIVEGKIAFSSLFPLAPETTAVVVSGHYNLSQLERLFCYQYYDVVLLLTANIDQINSQLKINFCFNNELC